MGVVNEIGIFIYYFNLLYSLVTTVLCFFSGVFLFSIAQWAGVSYGKYKYPNWAEFCGWVLALASMLWIPGVAIYKIIKTPGRSIYQRLCFLLRPDHEEMKAIEIREGLVTHSETQNL